VTACRLRLWHRIKDPELRARWAVPTGATAMGVGGIACVPVCTHCGACPHVKSHRLKADRVHLCAGSPLPSGLFGTGSQPPSWCACCEHHRVAVFLVQPALCPDSHTSCLPPFAQFVLFMGFIMSMHFWPLLSLLHADEPEPKFRSRPGGKGE
jgi:hypothetical protein